MLRSFEGMREGDLARAVAELWRGAMKLPFIQFAAGDGANDGPIWALQN